jgi:hypothetical protein
LDLFGGSGSTLIAAQQTARRAFLMELDPLYCDVVVQRYEQFTGAKAQRRSGLARVPGRAGQKQGRGELAAPRRPCSPRAKARRGGTRRDRLSGGC